MWFALFGAILVLAITFFQGLQGLFSSVIMCTLTILSAALAFGMYENVYFSFLITQMPNHGEAVALIALFAITLIVLRTAADNLIPGGMVFPVWIDRIGGGSLGLVTSLIIVGMVQIGFQLLPFDDTFLGYNRFAACNPQNKAIADEEVKNVTKPNEIKYSRSNLYFKPDDFTVSLVSSLSNGALSGGNRFSDIHPDFTAGLQNSRAGIQRESNRVALDAQAIEVTENTYRLLAPGDMVRLAEAQTSSSPEKKTEPSPPPPSLHERRAYSVALSEGAKDADGQIRFRSPQVRIVGKTKSGTQEFPLIGVGYTADATQFFEIFRRPIMRSDSTGNVNFPATGGKTPLVFVFDVPQVFEAQFIEYKRTARADVGRVKAESEQTVGKKGAKTSKKTPDKKQPEKKPDASSNEQQSSSSGGNTSAPPPSDRISGVRLVGKEPKFDDQLPLVLTSYSSGAETKGNKLVSGHILAKITDQKSGDKANALEVFDVPGDSRLLYVPVAELDPQSFLGNARGFAERSLPSISLAVEGGEEIRPAGKYAIAKVDDEYWLECRYLGEEARQANSAIPGFEKLKHSILTQGDTDYVYLFVVPKGKKATAFLRAKRPPLDLSQYNLVAK